MQEERLERNGARAPSLRWRGRYPEQDESLDCCSDHASDKRPSCQEGAPLQRRLPRPFA